MQCCIVTKYRDAAAFGNNFKGLQEAVANAIKKSLSSHWVLDYYNLGNRTYSVDYIYKMADSGSCWFQHFITLKAHPRGCHLITDEISKIAELRNIKIGLCHVFRMWLSDN